VFSTLARHSTDVRMQKTPVPGSRDIPEHDEDEAPETPLTEPPPVPIQDPPSEPVQPPQTVQRAR